MAKSKLKPKIIVFEEGAPSLNLTEDVVSKTLRAKTSDIVEDAVSLMATNYEPEESAILCNQDLNVSFANMSDTQAKTLIAKDGIMAVEDDELAYAIEEHAGNESDTFDDFVDEDIDATTEIDDDYQEFLTMSDGDFNSMIPTSEELSSSVQNVPEIDDIDFDENGQLISLMAAASPSESVSKIPIDKLLPIIKCILKCASDNYSGKVAEVSDTQISEILNSEGLEGSSETTAAIRDYITCGLRIIYAPYAWRYSTGRGVRVAVVDTGISSRHHDLTVYGGASFVPGVTSWNDDHYHGTHVAGTVAARMNNRGVVGVAPHARLYAVKVLDKNGSGYTSWILNGLAWCWRRRMHVANLSLGSGANTHNTNVYSRAYERAGWILRRHGILPVAAAGNSGGTAAPYVGNPARCPSFMAVGSIDCRRRRSRFSSYGPQVEICAPGSEVWSTLPNNRYGKLNGTSMAAPHVAGAAALVKRRRPSWSGDSIRVHLRRTAIDLGFSGRDWLYGYGQVNTYRAVL